VALGQPDGRRRRLWAVSRFPETVRRLVIEWTADGTDYLPGANVLDEEFAGQWQTLYAVLAQAPQKPTRADIRRSWPEGPPPGKVTLSRWLEGAVSRELLLKDGRGRRDHPFRYWLPEREAVWRHDPLARILLPELFDPQG
jgi:hypothetical protein